MSRHRAKLILLCEDTQHAVFGTRFFKQAGEQGD